MVSRSARKLDSLPDRAVFSSHQRSVSLMSSAELRHLSSSANIFCSPRITVAGAFAVCDVSQLMPSCLLLPDLHFWCRVHSATSVRGPCVHEK